MVWAIFIIVLSVGAGTLLAILPRRSDGWMGLARTFALTAALAIVLMHLMPESLRAVGAWGFLSFVGGLLAPGLLERVGRLVWSARRDSAEANRDLALEAGYAGLLLHRVGDGVGLGAFTGELQLAPGSGGVVAALAAHAVPVVAIVVLTFDSVRGRGTALVRAAGLAVASVLGVLMAHTFLADVLVRTTAWVSAFVGGMLLHVVFHDLSVQRPVTRRARWLDMVAGALGVLVGFIGLEAHGHAHEAQPRAELSHVLLDLAIETGPLLILGLAVGAVLSVMGSRIPIRFFESRGSLLDAVRGAVIGAPLPLCSCSVLPISAALKARGAAPALVVAFLLCTPELGVETFALSVRLLGWELAALRLGGALVVSIVAALALAFVVKTQGSRRSVSPTSRGQADGTCPVEPVQGALQQTVANTSWWNRFVHSFDELFHHVGAWMLLGIVAAAMLEVSLPARALADVEGTWLQYAVVTAVAVPSYVCAPSATPLAAVLLAKGLSPGAVLVGLLLGPATNIATVVFLRRWFGGRAALAGLFSVVVLAWLMGVLTDLLFPSSVSAPAIAQHLEHGVVWQVGAVLSGLLLIRALWLSGVRGFVSTIQGEHGHSHGGDGSGQEWHGSEGRERRRSHTAEGGEPRRQIHFH